MREGYYYGKIGSQEIILRDLRFVQPPEGWVEMASSNLEPPTKEHVIDAAGDWVLDQKANINAVRQELYLKQYPVPQQLEIFMDALLNEDRTKLNKMKKDFDQIRQAYPKHTDAQNWSTSPR